MNLNPKMTRTLLAILAAAVAAIVAFNVLLAMQVQPTFPSGRTAILPVERIVALFRRNGQLQ